MKAALLLLACLLILPSVTPGSDFAVVNITSPPDSVPLDSQVVPTALVHAAIYNQSESVSVRMRIDTAYDHTTDTVIPAGAAINVTFPTWQAQPLGVTTARCTLLTPDNDSTNNALSKQAHVYQHTQPGGPPAVEWTRTFLGGGSAMGYCVVQSSDGGYVTAGRKRRDRHGSVAYLVKVDSQGSVLWEKTPGGIMPGVFAVQPTADGGYILAGTGKSVRSQPFGACLVKTDGQGNTLWERVVSDSVLTWGSAVVQTEDGGFMASAVRPMEDTALLLIKTDSLGSRQWSRVYPVSYPEYDMVDVISLRRTGDGGYILGTRTLLKVDSAGNQQWLRTFSDLACANSAQQTADGGYIASGPGLGYEGIYLFKTDSLGNRQWKTSCAVGSDCRGLWVEQTSDGGYVVAGSTQDSARACVIRTDASGSVLWTKALYANGSAECIRQTADGGFIITGAYNDPSAGEYGTQRLFLLKLERDR